MHARVNPLSEGTVTPSDYVAMFREQRSVPEAITGICGRIMRGTKESDFKQLTFMEGRRLAWVFGPATLRRFIGKPGYQILVDTGKTPNWVAEKLREGMKWKLMVFAEAAYQKADWDGLFRMIEQYYPEVAGKLLRWERERREKSLKQMLADGSIPPKYACKKAKDNPKDPDHFSLGKYKECKDDLASARLFLWHSLGINELYAGDGYSRNENGDRCEEECLMPVRDSRHPPVGHTLVDLHVSLPLV